jgi:hypothetical protein
MGQTSQSPHPHSTKFWYYNKENLGPLRTSLQIHRFRAIERVARRKLLYLHRARTIQDLRTQGLWRSVINCGLPFLFHLTI